MNSIVGLSLYLVLGTIGGFLGAKLKITGGVLIGAMLIVIFVKIILNVHWEIPKQFSFVLQIFLGIMVGATFQPAMIKILSKVVIPVIISTLVLVGTGILLALIFIKLGILDTGTAYLGTSPGAMSALIVLALDSGTNAALVTAFHFVRVVVIVLTTPFIFKFFFD
ncbi:MAG: AbrB family transcriptional regulator [Desulfobacterales bacterium]|nr:MAG: AbrB family transcriptional regulator [Desulfobacterales bacterium]